MNKTGVLAVNPEADAGHQAGLLLALDERFSDSYIAFTNAEDVLTKADQERTLDAVVQQARIVRDHGLVHVQASVARRNRSEYDEGYSLLERSLNLTEEALSPTHPLRFEAMYRQATPKKARREALTVGFETRSWLCQAITARQVAMGVNTRGDSHEAIEARNKEQQPFGLAHDLFPRGVSRALKIELDMAGVRQEKINGRQLRMLPWLGRASLSLILAVPRHPRAALTNYGQGLRHLIDYEGARATALMRIPDYLADLAIGSSAQLVV